MKELIEKHQTCINIIEGIQSFKNQRKHIEDSITGYAGTFPTLKQRYEHRLDIIDRCINRLQQRYQRVCN